MEFGPTISGTWTGTIKYWANKDPTYDRDCRASYQKSRDDRTITYKISESSGNVSAREVGAVGGPTTLNAKQLLRLRDNSVLQHLIFTTDANHGVCKLEGVELRYDKEDPYHLWEPRRLLADCVATKSDTDFTSITGAWEGSYVYVSEATGKLVRYTCEIKRRNNGTFRLKYKTPDDLEKKLLFGEIEWALVGQDTSRNSVFLIPDDDELALLVFPLDRSAYQYLGTSVLKKPKDP